MHLIPKVFKAFEMSGKSAMGIFSMGMFVGCVAVVVVNLMGIKMELPSTVVDVYKWSLTLFAASKTATKIIKPKEVK